MMTNQSPVRISDVKAAASLIAEHDHLMMLRERLELANIGMPRTASIEISVLSPGSIVHVTETPMIIPYMEARALLDGRVEQVESALRKTHGIYPDLPSPQLAPESPVPGAD